MTVAAGSLFWSPSVHRYGSTVGPLPPSLGYCSFFCRFLGPAWMLACLPTTHLPLGYGSPLKEDPQLHYVKRVCMICRLVELICSHWNLRLLLSVFGWVVKWSTSSRSFHNLADIFVPRLLWNSHLYSQHRKNDSKGFPCIWLTSCVAPLRT